MLIFEDNFQEESQAYEEKNVMIIDIRVCCMFEKYVFKI